MTVLIHNIELLIVVINFQKGDVASCCDISDKECNNKSETIVCVDSSVYFMKVRADLINVHLTRSMVSSSEFTVSSHGKCSLQVAKVFAKADDGVVRKLSICFLNELLFE